MMLDASKRPLTIRLIFLLMYSLKRDVLESVDQIPLMHFSCMTGLSFLLEVCEKHFLSTWLVFVYIHFLSSLVYFIVEVILGQRRKQFIAPAVKYAIYTCLQFLIRVTIILA